jgi:hypothetical protein
MIVAGCRNLLQREVQVHALPLSLSELGFKGGLYSKSVMGLITVTGPISGMIHREATF